VGFDVVGSSFSILDVIFDGVRLKDRRINNAKLLIALLSLIFDCIFIVQHFILYGENGEKYDNTRKIQKKAI